MAVIQLVSKHINFILYPIYDIYQSIASVQMCYCPVAQAILPYGQGNIALC